MNVSMTLFFRDATLKVNLTNGIKYYLSSFYSIGARKKLKMVSGFWKSYKMTKTVIRSFVRWPQTWRISVFKVDRLNEVKFAAKNGEENWSWYSRGEIVFLNCDQKIVCSSFAIIMKISAAMRSKKMPRITYVLDRQMKPNLNGDRN